MCWGEGVEGGGGWGVGVGGGWVLLWKEFALAASLLQTIPFNKCLEEKQIH